MRNALEKALCLPALYSPRYTYNIYLKRYQIQFFATQVVLLTDHICDFSFVAMSMCTYKTPSRQSDFKPGHPSLRSVDHYDILMTRSHELLSAVV